MPSIAAVSPSCDILRAACLQENVAGYSDRNFRNFGSYPYAGLKLNCYGMPAVMLKSARLRVWWGVDGGSGGVRKRGTEGVMK